MGFIVGMILEFNLYPTLTPHILSKLRPQINPQFTSCCKLFVGFTMMCDTGGGAVEMRKTAVRFPHIPTALLRCLRRFFRIERKKGGK